ncbi:hypothetical protein EIP86_003185 [Pleurotus ostreatoroseus]|nr:hypothetical protein EIP86_003185 [Pleurotus ostreatoroseus]
MLDTKTISLLGLDGHSEGLGPPPADISNVNGKRPEFVIPRTGMVLKFKRMKEIWDEKKKDYVTLEDTQSNDTAKDEENSDADYAFTLVREYRPTETPFIYTTAATIHIRSPYFLQAAQIIMKGHRNVAWNAIPVKFPVETILSLLPKFREYRDNILTQARSSGQAVPEEMRHVQEHLDYAVEFLNLEYHSLLQELSSLLKEKRITWPLLWGIYATGTLLLSSCELTREPKLLRLSHTEVKKDLESGDRWLELNCEYVEYAPEGVPGFAATEVRVPEFEGAMPITDLPAFPMSYLDHDRAEEIRQQLLERGQKYHKFSTAPFHATYSGVAYRMYRDDKYKSTAIDSRIMIDRDMFNVYCPTHSAPDTRLDLNGRAHPNHRSLHENRVTRKHPSNEEFMLMPARIYGFSLADQSLIRAWEVEFNIVYANEISWQQDIFEKLEFPTSSEGAKKVIRSLISCHSSKTAVFDDLISGKGVGLVINLHGRAWKAVVLIDEADVFLQQRTDSAQDQRRNAMVSIFLKQLESVKFLKYEHGN